MRSSAAPPALSGEDGSVLPLILGYVLLALAVVYVCVCATDLYLAQKRLDAVADAAALAGADSFVLVIDDGAARAALTETAAAAQARAVVGVLGGAVEIVSVEIPDDVSARVAVRAQWAPPLLGDLVPASVVLGATATSRTALR